MFTRIVPCLVAACAAAVTACGPILGNQAELPRPTTSDFPAVFATPVPSGSPQPVPSSVPAASAAPGATPAPAAQTYDPFADNHFADVSTPTLFDPVFELILPALKVGDAPSVSTAIYQTSEQLQVAEVDTLIEHASFHFEKLKNGMQIGSGKLEIGTPPKLTLPVAVRVEDTDAKETALVSVKSDSAVAHVYIADLQIKVLYGSLAIISLANAARASATEGVTKTPRSARITQTFDPGYVQLPATPGTMRTRVIIKSVADPTNGTIGQKVFNGTQGVSP